MPFPLIPILISVASAILIKKGINAVKDNSDTKDYNRMADNTVNSAKDSYDKSRKAANTALEALGGKKLFVLDKSISRFITSFEKLKNVKLKDSAGMAEFFARVFKIVRSDDELNKFRLDKESAAELKKLSGYASSILGGTAAGALAGFGAYSVAQLMAAGSALFEYEVYGAGAAIAKCTAYFAGRFAEDAKASADLDKAKGNYAEAQKIAERLRVAAVPCNGIRRRSYIFYRLLIRLDALFFPLVFSMETIIAQKGDDWNKFNDDDKHTVTAAASLAKAIKTVIDTPILTEDGKLTEESAQVAQEVKPVIEAFLCNQGASIYNAG